jgi:hypothetical protein
MNSYKNMAIGFSKTLVQETAHDEFCVQELSSLSQGGGFFDVLALHRADPRLQYLAL